MENKKKYKNPDISIDSLNTEIMVGIITSEPHDPNEALVNSFNLLEVDEESTQNENDWDSLIDQI